MKAIKFFASLSQRLKSDHRYHTAVSQMLALLQQLGTAVFLLMGLQHNLVVLISWVIASILLNLVTVSRMVSERPTRRGLRRVLREVEVWSSIANAILIVFLGGSVINLVILFSVYVVGLTLTAEIHGRRWIQFD